MSNTYKAVYKCRLCGKMYDGAARTGEDIAIREISFLTAGITKTSFPKREIHYYDSDTMGIAEFVGWAKEK